MTILIGARLDDGRKVLMADGNVYRGDNERVTCRAQKVRSISTKSRTALIGVSGDRGALQVLADVVEAYLKSPETQICDLGYRLMARVKELGVAWDSNALAWLPSSNGYQLVSIDGIMSTHAVTHQNFWAEGTGRVHALGAYLGLVMHTQRCDNLVPLDIKLEQYQPSVNIVQTCYDVACENDAYCGGEQTLLALT